MGGDSGWVIISPSIQRRAANRVVREECRPVLSLERSGASKSGLGTHQERPRWIPADGQEESRLGPPRPGQGPRIVTERDSEVLPTEGAAGPKGGIQVDCSWEHRRRHSALRLLIRLSFDEGMLGSYRSNFLSRKSLTASQK